MIVITYGTFDLFHVGHLRLLQRARQLGDKLIVGVSTDEFNIEKGKRSYFSYDERAEILLGLKCVDHVFPEKCWDQKASDVRRFNADVFCMGSDWFAKFDFLDTHCRVVYLPRTDNISSSKVRKDLSALGVGVCNV